MLPHELFAFVLFYPFLFFFADLTVKYVPSQEPITIGIIFNTLFVTTKYVANILKNHCKALVFADLIGRNLLTAMTYLADMLSYAAVATNNPSQTHGLIPHDNMIYPAN
jgi:hypothetical protein